MKYPGEVLQRDRGFFITGSHNFLRHWTSSFQLISEKKFENKKKQVKNENCLLPTTLPRGCCMASDEIPMRKNIRLFGT